MCAFHRQRERASIAHDAFLHFFFQLIRKRVLADSGNRGKQQQGSQEECGNLIPFYAFSSPFLSLMLASTAHPHPKIECHDQYYYHRYSALVVY